MSYMSDSSLCWQQAASPLPVSSYFDDALFLRELDTFFRSGPRYVGNSQSPMEDGMQHFHAWYRKQMGKVAAEISQALALGRSLHSTFDSFQHNPLKRQAAF